MARCTRTRNLEVHHKRRAGGNGLDSAIVKRPSKKGRRHIDTMDKSLIHGFFDDDGFEINAELIKKPSLCLICANNDNPDEEILCNLTRYDQRDSEDFKCFAYKKG
jgi:hypothetical protein